MFKVFVTRQIPQGGLNLLKNVCEVEVNQQNRQLTKKELLDKIKDKNAVITQLTDIVDKEFLDTAENLKIVANYAVGFNNIDLDYATKKGIYITNTPDVLTQATAELAWALLFVCARRIVETDKFTRALKWQGFEPMAFLGLEISGKTLGIVGAGRIGQAFGTMACGFNMDILYSANTQKEDFETQTKAEYVCLETLLTKSDFVSIHTPLTPHTKHLIGERELSLMKASAILINTSRGPIIDEKALINALKKRQIFAAGLDVFENEPHIDKELLELDNVVVLPHIGSATTKTRAQMSILACENIVDVIENKIPRTLINKVVLENNTK